MKAVANQNPSGSIGMIVHTVLKCLCINLLYIFITINEKYPIMGGFFHTEIFGGGKIVTPVKVKDLRSIVLRNLHGMVCGAGVCQYNLYTVRGKSFTTLFDMLFFIFGNDTYGYGKQSHSS